MSLSERSKQLYNIFENGFHLKETRQSSRDAILGIEDVCNNSLITEKLKIYVCGSFSEASVTPESIGDIDIVICNNAIPMLFDIKDTGPGISYLAEETSKPGYWKFKLIKDSRSAQEDDIDERDHKNFELIEDALYLKHVKSVIGFHGTTQTGPAEALTGSGGEHVFDMVFALRSEQIPPGCKARLSGFNETKVWNESTVEGLDKMGCLFVAASHPESDEIERGIQWRLSFSLQERHLITSMNSVQHKVYILMKLLKKEKLNISSEIISSYMCKTCMLYVIEKTPKDLWVEENLIECLLKCLDFLLCCIKGRNFPNYFVKKENMFERDTVLKNEGGESVSLENAKQIEEVGKTLEGLLIESPAFLFDIRSDSIGKSLEENDIRSIENRHRDIILKVKWGIIALFIFSRDLILYQIRPCSYEKLLALLDNTIENHATLKAYITPWIKVHVGMSLAAQIPDDKPNSSKVRDALGYIEQGSDTGFNASLAKTTVLFRLKQWGDCLDCLPKTDKQISELITACRCNAPVKFAKMPESFEVYYEVYFYREWGHKSIKEIIKNKLSNCCCFLPCEKTLIPAPLIRELEVCENGIECGIHDIYRSWVIVDAKVYLYTLVYLVAAEYGDEKRKKEAVQNIFERLPKVLPRSPEQRVPGSDVENTGHNHVTLNILGWIMMQEKRHLAAVKYFLKSWKLQPGGNAAKYHIRDLFKKLGTLSAQQRCQMERYLCDAIQLMK